MRVAASTNFCDNPLFAWLYFLTRSDNERLWVTNELVGRDDALASAYSRMNLLSNDEMRAMEHAQIAFVSRISREVEIQVASKEEGKEEGKKEIAAKLLSMGMSVRKVMQATLLPRDVVQALADRGRGPGPPEGDAGSPAARGAPSSCAGTPGRLPEDGTPPPP